MTRGRPHVPHVDRNMRMYVTAVDVIRKLPLLFTPFAPLPLRAIVIHREHNSSWESDWRLAWRYSRGNRNCNVSWINDYRKESSSFVRCSVGKSFGGMTRVTKRGTFWNFSFLESGTCNERRSTNEETFCVRGQIGLLCEANRLPLHLLLLGTAFSIPSRVFCCCFCRTWGSMRYGGELYVISC